MQVRRRLVLHVQGYDPHDAADVHLRFQQNYERTCALYGLTGDVGASKESRDGLTASWDVTTRGDNWQTDTRYTLLRFDDLVRQDMTRAPWWKIVQMYRTTGVSMLNGVFGRMLKANWRFALVAVAPILLITLWVLFGSFVGILCMNLVTALGAPEIVARTVGFITGFGGFASLLWLTEPLTGLMLRCDEAASIDQFAGGRRPDWSERLQAFAEAVSDAVQKSKADEAIVVGHGVGAALAVNVLGRALSHDGALGSHGPRVALLTLGASLPVVGFNPEAKGFRNRLRQLAMARDVNWIDAQSRDDLLSFAPFDPIAGHGIALDGNAHNPRVMTIRLADLWTATSMLRRVSVSKVHAQFLSANERRGSPYDYTMICCGPLDLPTRAAFPAQAEAALAGKFEPDLPPVR